MAEMFFRTEYDVPSCIYIYWRTRSGAGGDWIPTGIPAALYYNYRSTPARSVGRTKHR